MSLLLFGFLLLHLSSCVSVKQSRLGEAAKDEETMCKSEKLNDFREKLGELEKKLETKHVYVEKLRNQHEEMRVQLGNRNKEMASLKKQFAKIESEMEEMRLNTQKKNQNQEIKAEVKKELDNVLPEAVEQRLRDLPFEMVCAYKGTWVGVSTVTYDRITMDTVMLKAPQVSYLSESASKNQIGICKKQNISSRSEQ